MGNARETSKVCRNGWSQFCRNSVFLEHNPTSDALDFTLMLLMLMMMMMMMMMMMRHVCSMSPCPPAFQVAQPLQRIPLTDFPAAVSVRGSNQMSQCNMTVTCTSRGSIIIGKSHHNQIQTSCECIWICQWFQFWFVAAASQNFL